MIHAPHRFVGAAPLTWRLPTPRESIPVQSTRTRPPVCYVVPSSAHDVQQSLTELGVSLTEHGVDVWFIVPAT